MQSVNINIINHFPAICPTPNSYRRISVPTSSMEAGTIRRKLEDRVSVLSLLRSDKIRVFILKPTWGNLKIFFFGSWQPIIFSPNNFFCLVVVLSKILDYASYIINYPFVPLENQRWFTNSATTLNISYFNYEELSSTSLCISSSKKDKRTLLSYKAGGRSKWNNTYQSTLNSKGPHKYNKQSLLC